MGATVVIPDGPLDGREIQVTLVAKGEVDAAVQAERQRIQALLERGYPSAPDQQ